MAAGKSSQPPPTSFHKLHITTVQCTDQASHLKIRWPRTYHSPRPLLQALADEAHRGARSSRQSSGSTAGGLCWPEFWFAACCARWKKEVLAWSEKREKKFWRKKIGRGEPSVWQEEELGVRIPARNINITSPHFHWIRRIKWIRWCGWSSWLCWWQQWFS